MKCVALTKKTEQVSTGTVDEHIPLSSSEILRNLMLLESHIFRKETMTIFSNLNSEEFSSFTHINSHMELKTQNQGKGVKK